MEENYIHTGAKVTVTAGRLAGLTGTVTYIDPKRPDGLFVLTDGGGASDWVCPADCQTEDTAAEFRFERCKNGDRVSQCYHWPRCHQVPGHGFGRMVRL